MLREMKNMRFVALSIRDVGRRPHESAARHGTVFDLQKAAPGADPVKASAPALKTSRLNRHISMILLLLPVGFHAACMPGVNAGHERLCRVAAKFPMASIAGDHALILIEYRDTLIDVLECDFKLR